MNNKSRESCVNEMMNLETLANELFLDLFEYLHLSHLLHAFSNLNHRFNELLLIHFHSHAHANCESISKTNFTILCEHYLPTNIDRVISIHLSDDHETLQQTSLFLSYGYRFHQFTHLKSLSLSHIYSEEVIRDIITELHGLDYLTHLQINQCRVDHTVINDGWIFDQIWSLAHLTHCHFERKRYLWDPFFISPKIISRSIKYLYLQGFSCNSYELHRVFEHTINLETLNIAVEHTYDYQDIPAVISSMKKLTIFVQHSPYITNNLLGYMPNLTHLTIELTYIFINGCQWEQIIERNLPNLNIFHLKMEYSIRYHDQIDEEMNQVLDSFRSPFWMNKHQWYIQCHWYQGNHSSKAYLYTLPCSFNEFLFNSDLQFQSTCPNNTIHWSYDSVYKLSYENSTCHSIRFPNVHNLKLSPPFHHSFWSIVPNLNRLVTLNIKLSNNGNSDIQLQSLLQHTTCLYSLTLKECSCSYEFLFQLKCPSIRRLCLYDVGCFHDEECNRFTRSPLGIQCEVLFIKVKNRTNIIHLIDQMKNLRMLNVRSEDDTWKREVDQLSNEDELVDYLKNDLSKLYVISRGNNNDIGYVQVWIR